MRPSSPRSTARVVVTAACAFVLSGCGETAHLPVTAGMGTSPTLPAPTQTLIPTVHVAKATGWPADGAPVPVAGTVVKRFAEGLDHPRWLYVLPNGDVLVAESNAPPRPEDGTGVKGWFMKLFMRSAGATTPSADRITLLRDTDRDGVADVRTVFASGLKSPFGMTLANGSLFVATTDALVRFPYRDGQTAVEGPGAVITELPGGPLNHHWTKNVIASGDGAHLYVTVGSNSNVAENGIEQEFERAAIWEVEPANGRHRVLASGLRNPNGLGFEPQSGALWTAVNERDELGSDLVPDYMTSVKDGGFYGWPYSYYGAHVDTRVKPQRPDLVATALVPDYALGPHTASLGLAFVRDVPLLPQFAHGAYVGQHGSWNRNPRSGYKVIFVPFSDGRPAGPPQDVLTGFLTEEGEARGRPVGVAVDGQGALLVADDVGNIVWRVSTAAPR